MHSRSRTSIAGVTAAFGCIAALACAPASEPAPGVDRVTESAERVEADGPLISSLEVETGEERAHFILHVTNPTAETVTLHFSTGQRFDFVVRTREGEEIWRWSEGRFFTQALGTETIPPDETLTHDVTWDPEGRTGVFTAIGIVPARNRTIRRSVEFRVPAG